MVGRVLNMLTDTGCAKNDPICFVRSLFRT